MASPAKAPAQPGPEPSPTKPAAPQASPAKAPAPSPAKGAEPSAEPAPARPRAQGYCPTTGGFKLPQGLVAPPGGDEDIAAAGTAPAAQPAGAAR